MDEAGKDPLPFLQCLILCLLNKEAWKEEGGMEGGRRRAVGAAKSSAPSARTTKLLYEEQLS